MARRPNQPFNMSTTAVEVYNVDKGRMERIVTHHGTPPNKLTKGLRRHLKKVARQNPVEADRQMALIGG